MEVLALQCTGINKLELVKFKKPEPLEDAALLKINLCGICGTDIHSIEGKRNVKIPFIPGHEIVARVESMGKNANKYIKTIGGSALSIGDRVSINPRIVCGKCFYCQNLPQYQELCINVLSPSVIGSSKYPHLFGGWAEYLYVLPGSEIIKLPGNLSDELATLIEPFSCVVGCIDRYMVEHDWRTGDAFSINDAIVVYGTGAMGTLMVAGFHLAGAKKIIVLDINQERLDLAKEFGATYDINVASTNPQERNERIKAFTDGLGAGVVIEACGVPDTISEGIKILRRGGHFFEIGHVLDGVNAMIDPYYICRNEIKVQGYYAYPSSQCLFYASRLLAEYKLPYKKLLQFFNLKQYRDVIFNKKINNAIKTVFRI